MTKKKNGSTELARYLLCAYRAWERGIGLESYVRRHWESTRPDSGWVSLAAELIEAEEAARAAAEKEFAEKIRRKGCE